MILKNVKAEAPIFHHSSRHFFEIGITVLISYHHYCIIKNETA